MKKALAFVLAAVFVMGTACSDEKVMDKDGNILEYTESDVIKKSGFFMHITKSEDEAVYQPLLRPSTVGYQSFDTGKIFDFGSDDDARYILMADRDNLIPVLTGSNFLIFVETEDLLPSTFKFEKFEDKGYTFGGQFETKESESGLFIQYIGSGSSSYGVENSDFLNQWEDKKNIDVYSIDTIGGAVVGSQNIDSNGVFQGLEKDCNYEMVAFIGTKYEKVVVEADTHYLIAGDSTTVSQKDCVARTMNGYAIVKVPSNLETGYYLLNNNYLFFYDKENSQTPTTDQFVLDIPNVSEVDYGSETTESSYYEVTIADGDEEEYEDPGDLNITDIETTPTEAPSETTTEDTTSETVSEEIQQ